ncbi:MAG: response regulator [Desulfobacula sp.]|nr:response regulator [Desulfobacula sp.]
MDEFVTNKIKKYVDKIPMTRKDGQDIWTETVTRFTVKKSGNRIELHGISRDITERKIGEEKRQQLILELNREVENRKQAEKKANKARLAAESANQTKTRFISTISHELRTPLNAVLGIAQVMQLDQMLSQEQKSNLSIILSSGKHLLNLINDILDLSKIESEKLVLKKENINLFQLSDDLERIILDRSQKKGVAVYFFISQKIPKLVRTDGTRLRQVLINLLGNAVKFTDTGSVSLSIKVSRNFPQGVLWSNYLKKGDFIWIEFSVNDTGIGIESKHLDRIFEAFFQTGTSKNVHEGTGLGLVISKMLIQVMGGRLKVESQIGQGSRFTFQIPMEIVNPGQLSATMPCKIEGLEPGQSDFRILVVDDKPGNRQVLINLLKPFGFDLRQASDGRQAVSISQEWQPHLIWMDIQMPVMDGWEAAKKIRNQGNKDTCIIAVSAVVLEPDLKASIIGRCDGYLAKPYNVEDIFILLNRHLNIKLVYEAMEPVSSKDSPKEDLVQSLKELPPDLVRQLVHSASVLDSATIHEIINNINKLNPFLADHLKNMAQEYHYEKISMLAQSVLE